MVDILLKPATQDDEDFVNTLTRVTMQPYVEATWSDEKNREHYYHINRFNLPTTSIIYHQYKPIGRITLTEKDSETVVLEELHLLAEYQSRGIGSRLIRNTIKKAQQEGKIVFLIVLKTNPATQLYKRLGFKIYQETPERYFMKTETLPFFNHEDRAGLVSKSNLLCS